MSKIIDKEKKKEKIALASIQLFLKKGFIQTSIDEIAKSAKVAKGTIYLYFKNKEEIIFKIWDIFSTQHHKTYMSRIKNTLSAQQRILEFFNFQQHQNEFEKEQVLTLYQHFISAMLIDESGIYITFFEKVFQRDYEIIFNCLREGIKKGEFVTTNCELLSNIIMMIIKGGIINAKTNQMNFIETQNLLQQHIAFILSSYSKQEK